MVIPPSQPQFARPSGPSPGGGETIEATGGHPFWVISGEELDKRLVPEHCPAEVPNAAIPARWVNAIDLRIGDVLFTRDGRRVPATNVSVRHVKMKVYNLQVEGLENYAVGYSGILVHNTSGSPVPQLTPGQTRQMLGEAIKHVKSLPRDAAARADAFEALAKQIESHSGGAWSAARGTGTDGSIIFLGYLNSASAIRPFFLANWRS